MYVLVKRTVQESGDWKCRFNNNEHENQSENSVLVEKQRFLSCEVFITQGILTV